MGLHGKHVQLDQDVHFLLMLSMAGATVATAAEGALPGSFALAAARPMLLLLVGSWFVQIGHILFQGGCGWVGGWVVMLLVSSCGGCLRV